MSMRRSALLVAAALIAVVAATTVLASLSDGRRAAAATGGRWHWRPPTVLVDPDVAGVDRAQVEQVVQALADDNRGWRTDLGRYTIRIVRPGVMETDWMPGTIGRAVLGHGLVVITSEAWTTLGPRWAAVGGTLDSQRAWIVLHELGHLLADSADHAECPGPGQPAPVMRAVNYQIGECTPNVWPNPSVSTAGSPARAA